MKIWIVSQLASSPSVRMLLDSADSLGHHTELVHPHDYHMLFASGKNQPVLIGDEAVRELPEGVITRLGGSSSPTALHFVRHLELCGVICCNTALSIERARNKIRSFDILSLKRVPIPRTAFITAKCELGLLLERIPGPPWVAKLPESSQGKGVVLVESKAALHSLVDAVEALSGRLTLQEFIHEAKGCDIRVLVVGGKAVAAMRRRAPEGDFRANLHQGGSAEKVEIDDELRSCAESAAQAHELDIAGVDLMPTEEGYLVIEVNSSPGLKGVQSVSDIDLARVLIQHLEQRISSQVESDALTS